MKNTKIKLVSKVIAICVTSILISSCGDPKPTDADNSDNLTDNDTVKAVALNVGGELFSVPSPIQTAVLIQKTGIQYDKSILNAGNKHGDYTSDYSKALNLGIYGADLGYVTMYNQTQDALSYLGAVKQLADKLGVSAAFDQKTMQRINENISNKDSMLMLVGVAYRASDSYLKTNKRTEISNLILTGGWIESMHFSVAAYSKKPTDEIKYRIAEQKLAINSIVKLIASKNLPEGNSLLIKLEELAKVYEGITTKYVYVAPTTDEAKKITYINSTTEINVSKEQLDKIASIISEIRNNIITVKS